VARRPYLTQTLKLFRQTTAYLYRYTYKQVDDKKFSFWDALKAGERTNICYHGKYLMGFSIHKTKIVVLIFYVLIVAIYYLLFYSFD